MRWRPFAVAATGHAGDQVEPFEARDGVAHQLLQGLLVGDGAEGRDVLVGEAMPEDQLAARVLEG